MHRRINYAGQQTTRFRPRQSSYLRISPTAVLQMTLYLEPAHVDWMNDAVLERMLVALKDRIPLKLRQEEAGPAKKSGKTRVQVDVFRGADYQMAFFFRQANDKHVVLLKDKHIHYVTRSPSTTRAASAAQTPVPTAAPPSRKRARTQSVARETPTDADDEETFATEDLPATKRWARTRAEAGSGTPESDEEELIVVKPEPDEDDSLRSGWAETGGGPDGLTEAVKEEIDDEVKPEVTVQYRGYHIFGRTLVVIVEPYPPLNPADLARPRLLNTEIRQLSASVAPQSYRGSTSVGLRAAGGRSASLSVTPAPASRDGGAGVGARRGPLFRSETTPVESERGSVTPSEAAGVEGDEQGEDEQMRRLREMSLLLANDDDDDLPSLDVLVGRARDKGRTEEAGSGSDGEGGEEGTQ